MALFSRNKDQSAEVTPADAPAMPPELSDYYQAERRERMWGTWLLSFVALLITVMILFALFLGGRWAYRRYVKKPDNTSPTIGLNTTGSGSTKISNNPSTSNSNNNSNSSPVVVGNNPTNSQTTTSPGVGGSSPQSTGQPQSSTANPSTAGSNNNAVQKGPAATSAIPNTGPGDVVKVFVLTSVLGAVGYNLATRKSRA